jgi:ATP-dependent Lon protease
MATAIASLVQGRPVSAEVGMTGEVTLTGQVLPIGGLKEKVLAAERAGLERGILARESAPELDALPPATRSGLEFVLAESMDDVLAAAFDGASSSRRRPHAAPEPQAARGR